MKLLAISDTLRQHLTYRTDGTLVWIKPTSNRVKVGDVAGKKRKDGYIAVGFYGKTYLLHRLIFMYHHGHMPRLVDHIDQDVRNNRIENLRAASKRINAINSKLDVRNKSGVRGVSWDKQSCKWSARHKHSGKYKFLGYWDTVKEAGDAISKYKETLP